MARPKRDGLLYFSLDTDFFYADRRIRALKSRFGSDGIVFYIYLLTEIYREGYYTRWNIDSLEGAMDELGFTEGLIEQIMSFLVGRSLLVKSTLANSDTVITSPGIQKRYQEAAKSLRRDVIVERSIWLLDDEETAPFIKFSINPDKYVENPDKSSKNESKCGKNPIKENKTKESKTKESKEEKTAAKTQPPNASQMIDACSFSPELDSVVREWVKYKIEKRQAYKQTGLRNFLSQVENNAEKYGEDAVINLVSCCMANNWQGVIWDRLEKGRDRVPQKGQKKSFYEEMGEWVNDRRGVCNDSFGD